MYVIARTATRNPAINGATLYLSTTGLWTIEASRARRFESRTRACVVRDKFKKSLRVAVKQEVEPKAQ
jgi:hypothetical protein